MRWFAADVRAGDGRGSHGRGIGVDMKLNNRVGPRAPDLEPEAVHTREPIRLRPWAGDGF